MAYSKFYRESGLNKMAPLASILCEQEQWVALSSFFFRSVRETDSAYRLNEITFFNCPRSHSISLPSSLVVKLSERPFKNFFSHFIPFVGNIPDASLVLLFLSNLICKYFLIVRFHSVVIAF